MNLTIRWARCFENSSEVLVQVKLNALIDLALIINIMSYILRILGLTYPF